MNVNKLLSYGLFLCICMCIISPNSTEHISFDLPIGFTGYKPVGPQFGRPTKNVLDYFKKNVLDYFKIVQINFYFIFTIQAFG